MCGLGHDDGELAWVRAAGNEGVHFMLPSLASTPFLEMTGAATLGQTLFFQVLGLDASLSLFALN